MVERHAVVVVVVGVHAYKCNDLRWQEERVQREPVKTHLAAALAPSVQYILSTVNPKSPSRSVRNLTTESRTAGRPCDDMNREWKRVKSSGCGCKRVDVSGRESKRVDVRV